MNLSQWIARKQYKVQTGGGKMNAIRKCLEKNWFDSEESAIKAAKKFGLNQSVYPCTICNRWHHTSRQIN